MLTCQHALPSMHALSRLVTSPLKIYFFVNFRACTCKNPQHLVGFVYQMFTALFLMIAGPGTFSMRTL